MPSEPAQPPGGENFSLLVSLRIADDGLLPVVRCPVAPRFNMPRRRLNGTYPSPQLIVRPFHPGLGNLLIFRRHLGRCRLINRKTVPSRHQQQTTKHHSTRRGLHLSLPQVRVPLPSPIGLDRVIMRCSPVSHLCGDTPISSFFVTHFMFLYHHTNSPPVKKK